MKTKTLLLGSAAALLMAGGAQAADLSIAAPVDYVRVCDAFGVGYWYIPGTDTCLKIGGYVQFDIRFQKDGWYKDESYWTEELDWEYDSEGFVTWIGYEDVFVPGDYHSSHWKFITEAAVDFTAASMTEYGLLESYAKFVGVWDYWGDEKAASGNAKLDTAWLRLGHVRMGKFGSVQNYAGGYSPGAWDPDFSTNQIELSWAASGFGLMLGIEDPQARWGTELASSMPNLAGAATFSAGHLDVKVTAGWSDVDWGSAYGISGVVSANMDQFSLRVGAAWANATTYLGGADVWDDGDSNWQAYISAIFRATSQVSIAGTFAYAANADDGTHATSAGAALVWAPVAGFTTTVEGKAWKNSYDDEHDWEAKVRFKRTFP